MMQKDVYNDQFHQNQPWQIWTTKFIYDLCVDLNPHGWKPAETTKFLNNRMSYIELIHRDHTKKIVVNLVHSDPIHYDNAIVVTDVVTVDSAYPLIKLYPEVIGINHVQFDYQNHLPNKRFNCFIHRACAFRQSWFYHLSRRDLLNQGHVTYWCYDFFDNRSPGDFYQFLFEQNNQIFEIEHKKFVGKIPYKNFDFSLEHAIIDSEKSLVIDTYFQPNGLISYSDKIWRAIQLPRPWLLFSSMHAVKYLREWGFDVFDDIVDHGYDNEPDPIQRQIMILDQLNRPIVYTESLIKELEDRTAINQNLLIQYGKAWPEKYKKIIAELKSITNNESLTLRA